MPDWARDGVLSDGDAQVDEFGRNLGGVAGSKRGDAKTRRRGPDFAPQRLEERREDRDREAF